MPKTPKPLLRVSICPCGYPVLHDSIPVGTVYVLDLDTIRVGFFYRCGGCGAEQCNVRVVNANQPFNTGLPMACLPLALFDSTLPAQAG